MFYVEDEYGTSGVKKPQVLDKVAHCLVICLF